jgi:uncharacterized membrane protein YpjA
MSVRLFVLALACWLLGVLYGGYLMERHLQDRSVRALLFGGGSP